MNGECGMGNADLNGESQKKNKKHQTYDTQRLCPISNAQLATRNAAIFQDRDRSESLLEHLMFNLDCRVPDLANPR